MSFPKYPAYKDSGVAWLGQVPEHWDVFPLKRDLVFLTSGSRGWAEHYSETGSLFLRIGNLRRDSLALDLSEIQLVEVPAGAEGERTKVLAGDVLFSITAYLGSVAVVPAEIEKAYVSQHVALARPGGKLLSSRWVGYVALSWVGKTYLQSQGYGGTKVQLSLDDIANMVMTAPSPAEQETIARYLDHETARIDALIEDQQRLIELLKEKRQAVISHAVTKGLDPNVPMKDSGVEWLGEVPAHWTVIKLALVTAERCDGPFGSALKSDHYTDEGVRVIRLQNIKSGWFNNTDSVFIDSDYYRSKINKSDVVPGDVLVAGLGDENNPVGRACVAPENITPAMVKADCFRFRLLPGVATPEFVALQLTSGAVADAGLLSTGSTRSRIPLSSMSTRVLALPSISEQNSIVCFIQNMNKRINSLFNEAQSGISLLQERRSALISAAVTGKIDLRGWQPPTSTPTSIREQETA